VERNWSSVLDGGYQQESRRPVYSFPGEETELEDVESVVEEHQPEAEEDGRHTDHAAVVETVEVLKESDFEAGASLLDTAAVH
jgi:hypothetical protein